MLENVPGHGSEPREREVAQALGQLATRNVARLRQMLDHVMQRGQHEDVRGLVVARVAFAQLVEYEVVQDDAAHTSNLASGVLGAELRIKGEGFAELVHG